MVAKAERSVGMVYAEIKAYIQIGAKGYKQGQFLQRLTLTGERSTIISLRESRTRS